MTKENLLHFKIAAIDNNIKKETVLFITF